MWHTMGYHSLRLAVNISQRQLVEREHLLQFINRILAETQFPVQLLELELVEPVVLSENNHSPTVLDELHAQGLHLALDDFGLSSSLNLLKRLPLSTLKIDQSFIKKMTSDDEAIIVAIITLAHSLKLKIVAEGVTTAAQIHFLQSRQCDEAQGYLISPPVPAATLTELLQNGRRFPI
jgi:EAL domain-containing protein (putative c-di-GMP-specific phosphodiesterase class I)